MTERTVSIAINTTALLAPLTGVGRYVSSLCDVLQTQPDTKMLYFQGFGWSDTFQSSSLAGKSLSVARRLAKHAKMPRALFHGFQQIQFSRGVRRSKPQVYHDPSISPLCFHGPSVLTVHDLSWIHFPESHPRERVKFLEKHFENQLKRADQIITDSEYVKTELTQMFGLSEHRVHAIHLASEPLFKPRDAAETLEVRARLGLKYGEYWLSVGTLEPRKNLHRLLDAFAMLPAPQRRQCPLVIIGLLGWGYAEFLPRLDKMARSGEVLYLGYVSRETQASLLSGAKALVYPSIYEGFGLPLVEAMQSGVPVIASNASCLPEVLGTAGCLFDPQDADGLHDHMKRLLIDDAMLESLSARCLTRSQAFDWGRCARHTVEVYQRAAEGNS